MRLTTVFLLSLLILAFSSCSKSESKIDINSDAELIAAIQKATNKQNISADELPTPSKTVLNSDYADNYVDRAMLAPKLGYQVTMRCEKGPRAGELSQAYFDMNGRHLRPEHGGKGGPDGKGDHEGGEKPGKMCFKLVLPVSFTMPDDSEITIEKEEDWQLIRSWYAEHPDVKKKPELQFPVDIQYRDGAVKTINNEEEMKRARRACKGNEHGDKIRCFELVLPVTYTMPDGSEITVEEKEDRQLIRDWYAPSSKSTPSWYSTR